ncbi:MAG: anhydro-N-acetylmuramic acid kinase [Candidatus Latescibacterota bacterium]|nr:anhydro-N-acetylmuramic acid kinase [Candidatus Latescibacterota bacterium]
MSDRLQAIAARERRRIVGLMTGTSVDAVDAVLAEVWDKGPQRGFDILGHRTVDLPADLQSELFLLFQPDALVADLCRVNFQLGEVLADAALQVIEQANMSPEDIDLIGSHGQTVRHLPNGSPAATLQIGEPAVIAERTGITTIADFRPADIAAGGQGAPLVPLVDALLFSDSDQGRLLLNIGGIANVTALPAGSATDTVTAFDTGPGNVLIDGAVAHLTGGSERFDRDGERAAAGGADETWVSTLMAHDFIQREPPKSTGREEFGTEFLATFMQQAELSPADLLATLTCFTARSVGQGISQHADPECKLNEVWVSGGGAHNGTLMSMLEAELAPRQVRPIDDLGVPADAKEALAFAVLAHETIVDRHGNVPTATGASRPAVLGKLCMPGLGPRRPARLAATAQREEERNMGMKGEWRTLVLGDEEE